MTDKEQQELETAYREQVQHTDAVREALQRIIQRQDETIRGLRAAIPTTVWVAGLTGEDADTIGTIIGIFASEPAARRFVEEEGYAGQEILEEWPLDGTEGGAR